jgi:hypothetical protein
MPKYEVQMDDGGRYELELDQEVSNDDAGRGLLQQLVHEQLAAAKRPPEFDSVWGLGTQILGGARDAVQGVVDLPAKIGNVITEFVSPDAPGGPRRRIVPEVQMPQLPDTEAPQTPAEKVVRTGAQVGTDAAFGLLLPGIRERAARLLLPERSAVRPAPLMFEAGRPAARGGIAGTKPTRTLAAPSGPLLEELSTPAQNLAALLRLPTSMQAIRHMTQPEASAALQRLMATLGKDFNLAQMQGPAKDLWQAIEQQLLRYR